ncbi:hypothetical protein F4821DRAFT_55152 [Hypoxylon rubiginosum]|uniref:Uncharacterized protein n=1 Tax=Hypoxylon rubiginosum TaxID=110542 RepID=A0ACC0CJL4_9PEZI|nr:hypothetical protein F4821DRAFT_55152 [Hypoxylon rubiginosum]
MISLPYHELSLEEAHNEFRTATSLNPPSSTTSCHQVPKLPAPSCSSIKTNTETTRHALDITSDWKHWIWELVASFFVLAIPLIIVGTLYPHSGQLIPQWPFRISVNALLSVYSVVFRICLTFIVASCIGQLQWTWFSLDRPLYDMVRYTNAANGSWGSFQLLWTQGVRQPQTALGALILILSVAIDPFIQQLLTSTDCDIKVPNVKATLPRTNFLDNSNGALESLFDPASSPMTGVSGTDTLLSWQCLTGNCTFSKVYGTLGFCSSCEDLSAQVVTDVKYRCGEIGSAQNSSDPCEASWQIDEIISSLSVGNIFFPPNGPWLNITVNPGPYMISSRISRPWVTPHKYGAVVLKGATLDSPLGINPPTGANITSCKSSEALDTWHCRGYGAASCALQPCVRFYNATIDNGQLRENLVSQYVVSQSVWIRSDLYGIVDTQCVSEGEGQSLKERGYAMDSRWISYNFSTPSLGELVINDTLGLSLLEHECLYVITGQVASTIGDVWYNQMSITNWSVLIGGPDSPYVLSELEESQLLQILYNATRTNFNSVENAFANFAEEATNWIRTHGNTSFSHPAVGNVMHYAICLQVNWAWISFPVLLASLTLILFIMVVVNNSMRRMPVWKSSPLVWILRWCYGSSELESLSDGKIDDMEEVSKDTMVVFSNGPKPHVHLVS